MKREDIKKLIPDITDEALNAIMAENGKDIEAYKAKITEAETKLKPFEGVDVEALKKQVADLTAANKSVVFNAALDGAIKDAHGRNAKAIRALIDVDALEHSEKQAEDIKAALEACAKDNPWAFVSDEDTQKQVSTGGDHGTGGTGTEDGVTARFKELNPNIKL